MLRQCLPLLLLPLMLSTVAVAQKRVLTLEEALRLADEQSLDLRRARRALERSSKAIAAARALYLPEVNASSDYLYNLQRPVLFVAPGTPFNETGQTEAFPIGSRHAAGLAIDLTQPLYDPSRSMRRSVAEAEVQVAEAQLGVVRRQVRLNAEKAFYRALFAGAERDVREQQVGTALANLDIILARFRNGRSMALDTITAGASLARARADAERARFGEQQALLLLAQVLDIDDYGSIAVEGALKIPAAPGPSDGDMVEPVDRMSSAGVHLAEARIGAAKTNVELEGAAAYPAINAVARWQALGQSNADLPEDIRWAMTSHVGISALYPLSELWRGNPRREEAELRVREAELELEQVRRDDSVQLRTLLLMMEGARAQVVAEQASLEQAQRAADITMILYREGRATLLDVEQAQARVREAELAEDRVTLQFLEAYAELKALVGGGE